MTFVIEKGIPCPPPRPSFGKKSELMLVADTMEVGDRIKLGDKHKYISLKGKKFATRKLENVYYLWRTE